MRFGMTGITSGVGVRLAEVLLARGDSVKGLVRSPDRADARALAKLGAELVPGDLDDRDALVRAATDVDAFFHCAAHVGDVGPREVFERVNVEGTKNAIRAAAAAKTKRFVQLSSVAVYGRPERGRVTEEWPTRLIGNPYEDTKMLAEQAAFELGRELGVEVSAVRPPIIYGPHDRNFLPRATEALAKRRFLLINGGRTPLNLVWVDHVVDVLVLAAEADAAKGEAFNVMDEVDATPPSVREVAETIAREARLPRPKLDLPYGVAMALGVVVEKAFLALRVEKAPPISPFVVKILTRDVIYDASKAARVLGWKSRKRSLEGVAEMARASASRA